MIRTHYIISLKPIYIYSGIIIFLHISPRAPGYQCYDTALYEVEKPGNFLGSGTRIAFVVLGRRILGGKPGVFQGGTSVVSVSVVHERNKAVLLPLSKQHI